MSIPNQSKERINLLNRDQSRASADMIDAAMQLEARAKELRAAAKDTDREHDARMRQGKRLQAMEAAMRALEDCARPISYADMQHAVDMARSVTLFAITAETAEIWIRDALAANSRLTRALRDRKIMRRYLAGRKNAEIAREFGISASQVGRIIKAMKADALGR